MKSCFFLMLIFTAPAVSADVPALVNGLVQLRSELETLGRDIESSQKELQSELDLWVQKRLELEASLQRETLRALQLTEKTNRLERQVKSESKINPQARPRFKGWIEQARQWVNSSLPFRREHRLRTVDALSERAERGTESLESLTAELWMFYENELKLAGGNEHRLLDISGPQGPDKAEVVRLGLFTMYSRDAKGQLQQTVFSGGQWTVQPVGDKTRADVSRLFENMKAKKDSGLYSLDFPREVL